jgi:2-polyprenyl-6-methoxyphenol hydroxylase-like FAD-dependent oxidoreductase
MNITIIGAGIGGLTTGIALQRIGMNVTIVEAAPEIKALGAGIALAANAMQVYERLGIADAIIKEGRLLDFFTICDQHGKVISRNDSRKSSMRFGTDNFTIHRGKLQRVLLEHNSGNTILTGKRLVDLQQKDDGVRLEFADGTFHDTDYVIAADGLRSVVRSLLYPEAELRYSGYTCWRTVVSYPADQLNGSSETWGKNGRFGIVPLTENEVYCFAVVNAPANDPSLKTAGKEWLLERFRDYHAPVSDLLTLAENGFIRNDLYDLEPPYRFAFGRVLLIGDAAHATTPNIGQGACQAIEDAYTLLQELEQHASPEAAFRAFEQRRLKRTQWVTETSFKIGKVAQLENRLLIWLRNTLFRLLPEKVRTRQVEKALTTDF